MVDYSEITFGESHSAKSAPSGLFRFCPPAAGRGAGAGSGGSRDG